MRTARHHNAAMPEHVVASAAELLGELRGLRVAGARLLADGRNVTDPARWAGTPRVVVGAG